MADDIGEGGPRTQESLGRNVSSDTEKMDNLAALVAAQQIQAGISTDQDGGKDGQDGGKKDDEDGQDVRIIVAEFPDGPLGTDDNKPPVVAQFFCEGEEVIFGIEEDSPFKMQLHGVYHEYQTHFRLRVGLPRTPTANDFKPTGSHYIELRFTQDLFDKPAEDIRLAKLTEEEVKVLPQVIMKESRVGTHGSLGQGIGRLTLQLNRPIIQAGFGTVFTHGHDKVGACLEKLSKVVEATQVNIFFIHHPRTMRMVERVRARIVDQETPFLEYNWEDSGKHQVQWKKHRDFEELPAYAHRENLTFHKLKYWYLTIMYGTLMNEEYTVKALESVEEEVRTFYLVEDPSSDVHPSGQPKSYIGYFDYAQGEAGVRAFDIGDECDIHFMDELEIFNAKEESETIERTPWKATVIPPLLVIPGHGNVTLIVRRPLADEDPIEAMPFQAEQSMPISHDVQIKLNSSDLFARRLVNGINRLYEGKEPIHRAMQRLLMGMDFTPTQIPSQYTDDPQKEPAPKPSADPSVQYRPILEEIQDYSPEIQADIVALLAKLDPSQRAAFDVFWETPSFFSVVTGPPGTGKSHFAAVFAAVLRKLNRRPLVCAPSNAAVDAVMEKVKEYAPELKPIRFHSVNIESLATTRQAGKAQRSRDTRDCSKLATENGDESIIQPTKPDDPTVKAADSQKEEDDAAAVVTYANLVSGLIGQASKVTRLNQQGRPLFSSMSLMYRCLEAADLKGEEAWLRNESDTIHKEFRELFLQGEWTGDKPDAMTLAQAITNVQEHVIREIGLGGTTLSNSDDSLIANNLKPDWLIIDEAATATEAEILIAITKHASTIRHVLIVGDIKQFRSLIFTRSLRKKFSVGTQEYAGPVCTFEAQISMSLQQRLQMNDYPSIMFVVQHRMFPGLAQPSSDWFYHGCLEDAPETKNSPEAVKVMEYMKSKYGLAPKVPRYFFDLQNGISLLDSSKSRYNLHNISFVMHLIEDMVANAIFKPAEIIIISPYKAQIAEYRRAFYNREHHWETEFSEDIWETKLKTIDSIQGGQSYLIICDLTTGLHRPGKGIGHMTDPRRLNVALTRAQKAQFLVGDLVAIANAFKTLGVVGKANEEEESIEEVPEKSKLQELGKIVKRANAVKTYDISTIVPTGTDHTRAIDWKLALDSTTCYNCQEKGHTANGCTNEAKKRPPRAR